MREELELFANNLNLFMEKYHYNQTTLANRIDVGVSTVADWVHGRKFPRIDKINKICELFHCQPSDLIQEHLTAESIEQNENDKLIAEYIAKLNGPGREHLLRYFQDMNPKFFKGGEENVQ